VRAKWHAGEAVCEPCNAIEKHGGRHDDLGELVFLKEGQAWFMLLPWCSAAKTLVRLQGNLVGQASLVVKRFKKINSVGREDLSRHMRRLVEEAARPPKLLPIITYLFREEKLPVRDNIVNDNLVHDISNSTNT
jgi:hypothetical protein